MVLSVLHRYEIYLYNPAYVHWKEEKRKEEEALDRKEPLQFVKFTLISAILLK